MHADMEEVPVKIRRMRDDVTKLFNDLEDNVVKNAKSLQTETLEKLTQKQSQNEKYLADIHSFLETIDKVYQKGTPVQQFITEHKMKEDVNVLCSKVNVECQNLEKVTVSFDFDETLILPPLPITDFVPSRLQFKSYLSENAMGKSFDNTAMKYTPIISINLKQGEDEPKEPLYRGIDFLPDGRLVAIDNKNKKCLVYDENLKKVGSYQFSFPPLSVAVVSKDEIAVTSKNIYILRVSKSNNISIERIFYVTAKYDSICQLDDGHFVVGTYDHSTPVRILTINGEEKDFNINFPNKAYPFETSACTYIRNTEKLVLTDRFEHMVYIYDTKTNTRVIVKDDRIIEPRGVVVGPSDTLLVCSENTNSIVHISQTGQILSSYKIDMTYPRTICISRDKSMIAVTNARMGGVKIQKLHITY